jgi:hypothetical protein
MSSRRARNRGDMKVTEERYPTRVFVNIYRRNFASEMFNVLMRESKVVCCFDAAVSEWHVTSRAVNVSKIGCDVVSESQIVWGVYHQQPSVASIVRLVLGPVASLADLFELSVPGDASSCPFFATKAAK